jgi:hypothetical protein
MSDPSFILMPPAPANSGMVFPNDKDNFPVFFRNPASQNPLKPRKFTSSEIVKLMSGQSYLCVFGFALYADQFNRHWTRFCGWVVYHDGAYNTKDARAVIPLGRDSPHPFPRN